jgi:hypothetical protein
LDCFGEIGCQQQTCKDRYDHNDRQQGALRKTPRPPAFFFLPAFACIPLFAIVIRSAHIRPACQKPAFNETPQTLALTAASPL